MRNIFLSLILSMVVCQISEATQSRSSVVDALVDARYKEHKALIESGATVNHKDMYGFPALIVASQNGHIEFVRSLLEYGDIQDEDVWTALMIASMRDHIEIVRLLLEYGADVNHPNKDGNLLDPRYERYFSEDVIRLLRESAE